MLYLYGYLPVDEGVPTCSLPNGIDGEHLVELIRYDDLYAVVSDVDSLTFSQENLERLIQDTEWLQEKARHHHEMIANLHKESTVIPVAFCTLFSDQNRVIEMMKQHYDSLTRLMHRLQGMHEWNVKIYCCEDQVRIDLMETNEMIRHQLREIAEMPTGRQFFMKKKVDKWIDDQANLEIKKVCDQVHREIADLCAEFQLKNTWSKEITGRSEKMVSSSVYLIPDLNKDAFVERLRAAGAICEQKGWILESSGPWPPYHFAKFVEEGSMER